MKLILFGDGTFASLAWYCLTHDSNEQLGGFVVDRDYRTRDEFHGLPVADFESLETVFPPDSYRLLLTIGPLGNHDLRRIRYESAKERGYSFKTYISSRAMTWPDLTLGENSIVFEGTIIQPFARVGLNTIVRSGVHISHHVAVGDHSFIAANACVGGNATIGSRCFIGLNATIRDGISVADGCFVAAGALVAKNTEPEGLYVGVPARRVTK